MRKKHIFLFSTVFLSLGFLGEYTLVPVHAEQAILNPQNPNEEIVPLDPSVAEREPETAASSSSTTETTSTTTTTTTTEETTSSSAEKEQAVPKQKPATPKRKKVFVTDELFPLKEVKTALNPHTGGGAGSNQMSFYGQVAYGLSGTALYGRKASVQHA